LISIICATDNQYYLDYLNNNLNNYLKDYNLFSLKDKAVIYEKNNISFCTQDPHLLYNFLKNSFEKSNTNFVFFLLDPLVINKKILNKIKKYSSTNNKYPLRFYDRKSILKSVFINKKFIEINEFNKNLSYLDFQNCLFIKNRSNSILFFNLFYYDHLINLDYFNKYNLVLLFNHSNYVIQNNTNYNKPFFFQYIIFEKKLSLILKFFSIFILKIKKKSYRIYLLSKIIKSENI
jgi:hypothetical protein